MMNLIWHFQKICCGCWHGDGTNRPVVVGMLWRGARPGEPYAVGWREQGAFNAVVASGSSPGLAKTAL